MSDLRIGQGLDRHRLKDGETLILGGVSVDSTLGTVGHSDGDVLVHSIVDALLGAAGLGDIGQRYPDDDSSLENANSLEFLKETVADVKKDGWSPINVDATVRFEAVRLNPYRGTMIETLRAHLPAGTAINLKFTTGEGVGPVGRDEAIEAQTVVLLRGET